MSAQIAGVKFGSSADIRSGRPAGPTPSDFLRRLFYHLDETGTRYCVLHSWGNLPNELPSDLDIAVHPADRAQLSTTFRRLNEGGFRPIQLFNYNVNGNYLVFSWDLGNAIQTAAVDFIFEHRRRGIIAAGGDQITATRKRCGEFWVASPASEFEYLLLKKTAKGTVKQEQGERLAELVGILGRSKALQTADELFPSQWSELLVSACIDGTLGKVLPHVRKLSWSKAVIRHPVNMLQYFAGNMRRALRRWRKPTGLLVAILGPDGVGKSSVTAQLRNQMGSAFRSERQFHWRPQFLARRKPSTPVTNPHANPTRGALLSSLYLTVFLLDYLFGYLLVLRQLKSRSCFLLFDRYFYDVLADPKRLRYGGPKWLARLYSRLVPTPDLVLVFDADTKTILSRKNEMPAEEIDQQREAYRHLPVDPLHLRVVQTEGTPEAILYQVAAITVEYMARRFERIYPEWLSISP